MGRGMGMDVARGRMRGRVTAVATILLLVIGICGSARAQERLSEKVVDLPGGGNASNLSLVKAPAAAGTSLGVPQLPDLSKRENLSSALQLVILLTVLSLAPAILIMMTSF